MWSAAWTPCFVADDNLENRPLPAQAGGLRSAGWISTSPGCRDAEAVLASSTFPVGLPASELAQNVWALSGAAQSDYGSRRAAYDLKKRRGQAMVRKIGSSRRYEPIREGLRAQTAVAVMRERVIQPLLAASSQLAPR